MRYGWIPVGHGATVGLLTSWINKIKISELKTPKAQTTSVTCLDRFYWENKERHRNKLLEKTIKDALKVWRDWLNRHSTRERGNGKWTTRRSKWWSVIGMEGSLFAISYLAAFCSRLPSRLPLDLDQPLDRGTSTASCRTLSEHQASVQGRTNSATASKSGNSTYIATATTVLTFCVQAP